MAKRITRKFRVETAFGNKLETPLEGSFSFDELEKDDEIPADERPNEDAIRGLVNTRRASKARASETNKMLDEAGIKKPTLDDPNVALATMVRAMVAQGRNEDEATQIARKVLGMN